MNATSIDAFNGDWTRSFQAYFCEVPEVDQPIQPSFPIMTITDHVNSLYLSRRPLTDGSV